MIVLMISVGVAIASHGELRFNLIGFIAQAAAVLVRAFLPFLNISLLTGYIV
jgi:hypothetical protein